MGAELAGMTQAVWEGLSEGERDELRSDEGLSLQLVGLEGWRVEVVTLYGGTRRFYVGRSTGWRPCHIEVSRRDSLGGPAAEREYVSVRRLYKREGC